MSAMSLHETNDAPLKSLELTQFDTANTATLLIELVKNCTAEERELMLTSNRRNFLLRVCHSSLSST